MIYRLLQLNRKITSHRFKFLAVAVARLLGLRYLSVRLDPLVACNLACLMCPFTEARRRGKADRGELTAEDLDRLGAILLPRALQLVVGCSYEPTLYEGLAGIVALGKKHGVPRVGLATNGQLITAVMLSDLGEAGLDEIIISAHGARKQTYEELMPGADFPRLHETLALVVAARAKAAGSGLKLRLNFTACRRNLDDIPFLLDVFGRYEPDVLQVRPMFGRSYPQGILADGDVEAYLASADELVKACRRRGITLLISRDDPRFERKNYHTLIMPAVYVYADPGGVWRDDFDWKNESYDDYCRRTGFTTQLIRNAFTDRESLLASASRFADSAGYEIIN